VITREWPLAPIYATAGAFLLFDDALVGGLDSAWRAGLAFAWLFGIILWSAFAVVRHAEALAEILGEPFGTLILTFAITAIEVMMIAAVMLTGPAVSTLARDTMFAVIMIVFNGMAGLALVLGGLRYHEQTYNLQGANAFLAVTIPLAVLGLVLPNFTEAPGPTLSTVHEVFLVVMSLALYAVFLTIQTLRHRRYFVSAEDEVDRGPGTPDLRPAYYHGTLLVLYIVPIILLSKSIALPIDYGVYKAGAPAALVGFIVAALILSPESLGAVRAALANQIQRSINLLLGSVLASISLTIPAVLLIAIVTGRTVILGLDPVDMVMLLLTLGMTVLTYGSGRTNILLGAVHLLLFFTYLVLLVQR
jgi:Ca2+:H+ antiporter